MIFTNTAPCGHMREPGGAQPIQAIASVGVVAISAGDAATSGLRTFASLAHGIQSDYAAVVNGLKLLWSTGAVEGTATKVKLLKRTGSRPRHR